MSSDERSLTELRAALRRGETTAVEVTEACLARIQEHDRELHAFATVAGDEARAAARAADRALSSGAAGALAGVPVAVKDLFLVRGVVRTNGSPAFADDAPAIADATAVARLRAAGAVIVGTTHLHELAFGPTGVNPALGTPLNPWDADLVPGGSSSGSGTAVAARLVPAALGTDTGGSVRIPSSFCGLTGLKPTYGRVSRAGITPLAWSLDHAGPMARSAADLAVLLGVIAGHDPADPTSARLPVPDYEAALGTGLRGLRLGVPRDFCMRVIEPPVAVAFERALADLRAAGATVNDITLPTLAQAGPALGATILAEAAVGLRAALGERRARVGIEAHVYLELGKIVTGPQYLAAQRLRTRLYVEMAAALARVDLLATPASVVLPPSIGALQLRIGEGEAEMGVIEAIARMTGPFNLTGLPALALPCGFTSRGIPIGLQLASRPFTEAALLAAGHAYQQATDFHTRRPSRGAERG